MYLSPFILLAEAIMVENLIFPIIAGLILIISFVLLFFSLRMNKKRRLVDNIPTSKTSGVYIGMVELKGDAVMANPKRSYLAEIESVYYSWYIEEKWRKTETESYTDSNGKRKTRTKTKSGWKTIDSGQWMPDFYLKDDEGHILIEPDGADIDALEVFSERVGTSDPLYYDKGPRESIMNSVHERRFVEEAIPYQQDIYVMGQSTIRQDIVAAKISEHRDAPMYLISVKNEEQISSGYKWKSFFFMLFGILLPCIPTAVALNASQLYIDRFWWVLPCVSAGFLMMWAIGWLWVVFNSMVDLKHRVQAAASNVDVQLKRRHDLIPQLVKTIQGLTGHEKETQELVATLRSQANASLPGEDGADPIGVQKSLFAIAEAYPELKSQPNFEHLQDQLTDCENRIALARGFYNEFASHLNKRLELFPDTFVAKLAKLEKRNYIDATGFERQSPKISFR